MEEYDQIVIFVKFHSFQKLAKQAGEQVLLEFHLRLLPTLISIQSKHFSEMDNYFVLLQNHMFLEFIFHTYIFCLMKLSKSRVWAILVVK